MQIAIRPNSFRLSIRLTACLSLLFTPDIFRAIEPGTSLAQYAHRVWHFGDAGLLGTPQGITQTADGYIWVSTSDGLFRFDGVRFTRWIPLRILQ
jgi:ligand-binding sensor domain-containing protein